LSNQHTRIRTRIRSGIPNDMKDACRYAERPFALLARYVKVWPVAHAAIVMAVLGAVGCSVGAQYGVKVLVDTLSTGLYATGISAMPGLALCCSRL
jgi:ATP-binding cassette, subfamily B, bacterial